MARHVNQIGLSFRQIVDNTLLESCVRRSATEWLILVVLMCLTEVFLLSSEIKLVGMWKATMCFPPAERAESMGDFFSSFFCCRVHHLGRRVLCCCCISLCVASVMLLCLKVGGERLWRYILSLKGGLSGVNNKQLTFSKHRHCKRSEPNLATKILITYL